MASSPGDRAATAGAAARVVVRALPGVLGLVLASFGAWLVFEPAGFITAGVLLLADRVATARQARPGPGDLA